MNLSGEEILAWYERVYQRTWQVVQAVQPAYIFYRPQEGEFSFSELIRHLAATELMNVGRIATGNLIYAGHSSIEQDNLAEYKAALNYFEECHRLAVAQLAESGETALTRLVATNQGEIEGWRVVAGMLEHQIHHRSQLCGYLAGLGIAPPPLFGIYTEDLPQA